MLLLWLRPLLQLLHLLAPLRMLARAANDMINRGCVALQRESCVWHRGFLCFVCVRRSGAIRVPVAYR